MDCYGADNKYHQASMKFRMVDRTMKRFIGKKVENTGVYRSQHQILMHLCHHRDCSQSKLAEQMEISPAAVAVSLKKLEKGGYIVRESRENDNRANQIVITEKGNEVIKSSISLFEEIDKAIFKGFSEEDIDMLNHYLDRMYENLEAYQEELTQK